MQAGIPQVVGDWGITPCTSQKIGLKLTQKCQFCHFHAVLGHFAQITSPYQLTFGKPWQVSEDFKQ